MEKNKNPNRSYNAIYTKGKYFITFLARLVQEVVSNLLVEFHQVSNYMTF